MLYIMYAFITVAVLMLVILAVKPAMTADAGGKIFAFVAILLVPVGVGFLGLHQHVERSKSTAFCVSCHPMKAYERSLHIDDVDHVAAKHWQYGRVPRETACFSCHTTYTMYGDYKAKLHGLQHVWVQYLGKVPDKIKLYSPYHNRECLHCHQGGRSFIEAVTHKSEPGRMQAILENKTSCLTSGCHGTVHTVDKLDGLSMWPPAAGQAPEHKEARK
jgi:hypothetical protein